MDVDELLKKIKNLEIQGATRIAMESCKVFYKSLRGKDKKRIIECYQKILDARPNEPLLENLLSYMLNSFLKGESIEKAYEFCMDYIERSYERIPVYFYGLLEDDYKVGTICHSSLVEKSLKYCFDQGKEFEVYVCETRPRFQGRITAKRLSEYGIKVKLFVDGSVWRIVRDCDLIVVGADVLLPNGIINKVGTKTMAILSDIMGKEFFVLSQLLKFRARFEKGYPEVIEMRDPKEVWDYENENLEIFNYSFDMVEKKYISGIVCEEEIFSYEIIRVMLEKKYPWMFERFF